MFGNGRLVVFSNNTEEDEDEPDYLMRIDSEADEKFKYIPVKDKKFLSQLTGFGGNSRTAETSNSTDAFNVFKFAADNSSPEWKLRGYNTEDGMGFSLSTSYDPEGVITSGDGSYKPSEKVFSLHSHPDDPKTIGPSGFLGMDPLSGKYNPGNEGGDLYTMIADLIINPITRHYIYHEGTKKLIYYDHLNSVNEPVQNKRGKSIGVVNTAAQMRKKIIGH
jgi:hypothetical protein